MPGRDDLSIVNLSGLALGEVTASSLLVCDFDGHVLDGEGRSEASPAFTSNPAAQAAAPRPHRLSHPHAEFHRTQHRRGGLFAWARLAALKFHDRTAIDAAYNGLALYEAEGDRISATLGDADVAFLRNRGVMRTGPTIAEAWHDLCHLDGAAEVQIEALSTGRSLRSTGPDSARRVVDQTREGDPESARSFREHHTHPHVPRLHHRNLRLAAAARPGDADVRGA